MIQNYLPEMAYEIEWVLFQGKQFCHFHFCLLSQLASTLKERIAPRGANSCVFFNPIALRKAKMVYHFGLSECNRVKSNSNLEGYIAQRSKQEVF